MRGELKSRFHYDSNILFNEQTSGPVRRAQFGQTLAITHPLFPVATHKSLSGVVELSHFTQPFTAMDVNGNPVARANTADLLFAATYAWQSRI